MKQHFSLIIFETYLRPLASILLPASFPFGVGNPERKPLFTLLPLSPLPLFQALPVGRSSCSSFLTSVGWSSLLPTHTIAGTPPDRAARCLHRHNVYIISCIFPTITPSNELKKIIAKMIKAMFALETACVLCAARELFYVQRRDRH